VTSIGRPVDAVLEVSVDINVSISASNIDIAAVPPVAVITSDVVADIISVSEIRA